MFNFILKVHFISFFALLWVLLSIFVVYFAASFYEIFNVDFGYEPQTLWLFSALGVVNFLINWLIC